MTSDLRLTSTDNETEVPTMHEELIAHSTSFTNISIKANPFDIVAKLFGNIPTDFKVFG